MTESWETDWVGNNLGKTIYVGVLAAALAVGGIAYLVNSENARKKNEQEKYHQASNLRQAEYQKELDEHSASIERKLLRIGCKRLQYAPVQRALSLEETTVQTLLSSADIGEQWNIDTSSVTKYGSTAIPVCIESMERGNRSERKFAVLSLTDILNNGNYKINLSEQQSENIARAYFLETDEWTRNSAYSDLFHLIGANSPYSISRTIEKYCEERSELSRNEEFSQLREMKDKQAIIEEEEKRLENEICRETGTDGSSSSILSTDAIRKDKAKKAIDWLNEGFQKTFQDIKK